MLLSVLYIIGITAEAMTGALSAGKQKMDWFGVMLVASATAIGGGTVRDILAWPLPTRLGGKPRIFGYYMHCGRHHYWSRKVGD